MKLEALFLLGGAALSLQAPPTLGSGYLECWSDRVESVEIKDVTSTRFAQLAQLLGRWADMGISVQRGWYSSVGQIRLRKAPLRLSAGSRPMRMGMDAASKMVRSARLVLASPLVNPRR